MNAISGVIAPRVGTCGAPLYESALTEVARSCIAFQRKPRRRSRNDLPAQFDAALYLWEQHYFFEQCLGRHFGVAEETLRELTALPALHAIAERLASFPRVLVHRDFQSQNIIVREEEAYLIDFQGMRPGLAEYDFASLLYDPYVSLTSYRTGRTDRVLPGSGGGARFGVCGKAAALRAATPDAGPRRLRLSRACAREQSFPRAHPCSAEVVRPKSSEEVAGLEPLRDVLARLA